MIKNSVLHYFSLMSFHRNTSLHNFVMQNYRRGGGVNSDACIRKVNQKIIHIGMPEWTCSTPWCHICIATCHLFRSGTALSSFIRSRCNAVCGGGGANPGVKRGKAHKPQYHMTSIKGILIESMRKRTIANPIQVK